MMRQMWVAAGFPRQHAVSVHSLSPRCETLQACWSRPIRRPPFQVWLAGVGWGYNDISPLWHHTGLLVHTPTLSLGTLFMFNIEKKIWQDIRRSRKGPLQRQWQNICLLLCHLIAVLCPSHRKGPGLNRNTVNSHRESANVWNTVNYIFRTKCLWYILNWTGLRC